MCDNFWTSPCIKHKEIVAWIAKKNNELERLFLKPNILQQAGPKMAKPPFKHDFGKTSNKKKDNWEILFEMK